MPSMSCRLDHVGGRPGPFGSGNNGVVLALLAERASGLPYHDLVRARVYEPAGMRDIECLRSDELPVIRPSRPWAADGPGVP
jgi:CubicO group peptidase (beta-lactamase class C family)